MLTQSRLKELLHYDPETGIFRWIVYRSPKCQIGTIAGSYNPAGYHVIRIDYKQYQASILAWLYMTGEWPPQDTEHKDVNPSNTKWNNIRLCTQTQNNLNRKIGKTNTTGAKGVTMTRDGKYGARLQIYNRKIFLGNYDTLEEAKQAYGNAIKWYGGEFARTE